jgi:hypothetical protein
MLSCVPVTTRASGKASELGALVLGIAEECIVFAIVVLFLMLLMPSLAKGREPPASDANGCTTHATALPGSPPCTTRSGAESTQKDATWPLLAASPQPPADSGIAPRGDGKRQNNAPSAGQVTLTYASPRGAAQLTVRQSWWWSGAPIPQWLWTGWTYLQAGLVRDRPDRPTCATSAGLVAWPPAPVPAASHGGSSSAGFFGRLPFTLQLREVTSYDPQRCSVAPAICWPQC